MPVLTAARAPVPDQPKEHIRNGRTREQCQTREIFFGTAPNKQHPVLRFEKTIVFRDSDSQTSIASTTPHRDFHNLELHLLVGS